MRGSLLMVQEVRICLNICFPSVRRHCRSQKPCNVAQWPSTCVISQSSPLVFLKLFQQKLVKWGMALLRDCPKVCCALKYLLLFGHYYNYWPKSPSMDIMTLQYDMATYCNLNLWFSMILCHLYYFVHPALSSLPLKHRLSFF